MTPEMHRTLTFIQEYYAQHGIAPTMREIMVALGGKSTGPVHNRIHRLIDRGHLVRLPGRDRAIAPASAAIDLSAVPTEKLLGELEKRRALHG
ncbi:LexA DNA binding domain-containing protein [Sphingobium faniae]|nr:LexA DNA binding domain-containing protein [Sphingobium faniae]